jgi:hypothetical protein
LNKFKPAHCALSVVVYEAKSLCAGSVCHESHPTLLARRP